VRVLLVTGDRDFLESGVTNPKINDSGRVFANGITAAYKAGIDYTTCFFAAYIPYGIISYIFSNRFKIR